MIYVDSKKLRRAAISAVLSAAALLAAGCDKLLPGAQPPGADGKPTCRTDVAEWTEGVGLYNGQEVVVWRRAVACKSGFPDSKRGRDLEFELKYEPMGLHWKGPSGLQPISFEIIDGAPYLTLYVMTGGICRDKPASTPMAKVMKWAGGQWIEVPIEQAPIDRALLNLHNDYWGYTAANDAKGFIPADGKVTGWNPKMTVRQYFAMDVNTCTLYHDIEKRREPLGGRQASAPAR